jgi:hypothetical protein
LPPPPRRAQQCRCIDSSCLFTSEASQALEKALKPRSAWHNFVSHFLRLPSLFYVFHRFTSSLHPCLFFSRKILFSPVFSDMKGVCRTCKSSFVYKALLFIPSSRDWRIGSTWNFFQFFLFTCDHYIKRKFAGKKLGKEENWSVKAVPNISCW